MNNRTCTFPNCEKAHKGHGLCTGHLRQKTKGKDLTPLTRTSLSESARFWSYVEKGESCWTWVGTRNDDGYGLIKNQGRTRRAHRVSYEYLIGAIPSTIHLDHKCHNPSCVYPAHLRPVTHKQNMEHQMRAHNGSKSGVRGVSENHGKWRARVRHNGELITVGNFSTVEEAEVAVIAKRIELFTHNDLDREV